MDAESFNNTFTEDEALVRTFKSAEQSAATTVWAAVANVWAGRGGKYVEDCRVSEPVPEEAVLDLKVPGYMCWAYDEDGARKLWDLSAGMVGVAA
jgi:hypothetical protein